MRTRTIVTLLAVVAGLAGPYSMVAQEEINGLMEFHPAQMARYTEPAGRRYQEAHLRMLAKAYGHGLDFKAPILVQTSVRLDIWAQRWMMFFGPVIKVRHSDGSIILIDNRSLVLIFTDDELDCAIGHELGHVIDVQTERRGPFFEPIRCLSSEDFADVIGAVLCGPDHWLPFRKYIGYSYVSYRTCNAPSE